MTIWLVSDVQWNSRRTDDLYLSSVSTCRMQMRQNSIYTDLMLISSYFFVSTIFHELIQDSINLGCCRGGGSHGVS